METVLTDVGGSLLDLFEEANRTMAEPEGTVIKVEFPSGRIEWHVRTSSGWRTFNLEGIARAMSAFIQARRTN